MRETGTGVKAWAVRVRSQAEVKGCCDEPHSSVFSMGVIPRADSVGVRGVDHDDLPVVDARRRFGGKLLATRG